MQIITESQNSLNPLNIDEKQEVEKKHKVKSKLKKEELVPNYDVGREKRANAGTFTTAKFY